MQMTSSSVPVCDLCENGLFWRRDSALGITDEPFVKGTQWGAILSEVSFLIFMLQRFHEIFIWSHIKIFKFLNQCFAQLRCWKKCLEFTKLTCWINSCFLKTLFLDRSRAKHWSKHFSTLANTMMIWWCRRNISWKERYIMTDKNATSEMTLPHCEVHGLSLKCLPAYMHVHLSSIT